MTGNEQFVIPSNIKQIGSIAEGTKVYVEDYVSTYSMQYAVSDKCKEKVAVLVGRCEKRDDEDVIFISGIIQGQYATRRNSMTVLTEKSWQYIEKQMELYFKDCEIVGWMYVQPGFEDYINDNITSFQTENADRGLRLLYLSDPQEGISSFYMWDKEGKVFSILKGYIIYYDKNEGMHEYMLENKLKPINPKPELEMPEREDAGAKARKSTQTVQKRQPKPTPKPVRGNAEQVKMINLLGGASFVMLVVCMIMGAGLIQNGERLSEIESRMNRLQADFDGTKSVFAAQSEQTTLQITETTTMPTTSQQTTSAQPVNTTDEPQTQKQAEAETYIVQSGDTLINISKKIYGTAEKVDEIRQLNNISESRIVAGEELKLP
jgi:LysM repeat protein